MHRGSAARGALLRLARRTRTPFPGGAARMGHVGLGKSALLAAIFSVHFAVLESMPLTLEAGLAYAGSVTVLALGVVVAGNFASTLVRFCFCACCCRGTQASERARMPRHACAHVVPHTRHTQSFIPAPRAGG